MLTDLSLADFSARAAAREPTPGGGSVAACMGNLGAALGAMAARFSEGRADLAAHAAALSAEIRQLDALRTALLALVDADAQAYGHVSAAYALPKADEAGKRARQQAIQAAVRGAMEPPLEICRLTLDGLELLDGLRHHVNAHLASDVAVGAYALAAAHRSAWVNVLVNLAGLKDGELRRQVLEEGRARAARVAALETAIAPSIEAGLLK